MNQAQWKQIVTWFLITFAIAAYTLRYDTQDANTLIWYAFEKQIFCFIYSLFGAFGYSIGLTLYAKYFKKKE